MTMTIEKIEFPRRETKQNKTKKSLTIDSEDELVVSAGKPDQGIAPLQVDKSLEPEHSLEDDNSSESEQPLKAEKSSESEQPQNPDKSSATLEAPVVINETISSIQTAFENHLMEDGKGSATIASYTGDIQGFIQWLAEKKMPFEGRLTRLAITSYRKHLQEANYRINTINKKINSLHSFNHFLISQGFCHEKVVHPQKDKIQDTRGRFYCVA